MISWNIGQQGLWSVRTAIRRLTSDTHSGIMLFQDVNVALEDTKKVLRACREYAPSPFYNPSFQGDVTHNALIILAYSRC